MNKQYDAQSIKVLKGLEAVRKVPGMYIGSTNEQGLHHLVYEILDNSIDEVLGGFANAIEVVILPGDMIKIIDNGRSIPVGVHPVTKKSAVETILTTLHAGGKFDKNSYQFSGGLHGVGASVVNALSEKFIVTLYKNGQIYQQEYSQGKKKTELIVLGETKKQGTEITFLPDKEIFLETTVFNFNKLLKRLEELAFLNKKLNISIEDKRKMPVVKKHFYYEKGIIDYLTKITENEEKIQNKIFAFEEKIQNFFLETTFLFTKKNTSNILSFVNNIKTLEGGTHEESFKKALKNSLFSQLKNHKTTKKTTTFLLEDILEGINVIISLRHPAPQFKGQTKDKLENNKIKIPLTKAIENHIESFLLENPEISSKIIDKCLLAAQAREAAQKAKEQVKQKNIIDSFSFASKLSDCRISEPEKTELYIVEGKSAGGSAKQGRDSLFQAILPLRGKVINVEKAALKKMLQNNEILSLMKAIGVNFNEEIQLEKIRYHKIVIMTDADVDGAHIRTLLLTFFFRYFKKLIELGFIYIAQPPLYKIKHKKNIHYFYEEDKKDLFIQQLADKYTLQRYKGLGEMNPEQLWDTTMNPEKRTLLKVNINDFSASSDLFNILMGKEVSLRTAFIQENSNNNEKIDLDI